MSTPISLVSFNAYVAELTKHDWFYEFSDDGSVYRAGRIKYQQLINQADSDPIYQKAYGLYAACGISRSLPLLKRIEVRETALDVLRNQITADLVTQAA